MKGTVMKNFHSTDERYHYIFGNTARKLDLSAFPERSRRSGKKPVKRKVSQRTIERRAMEKAQREADEAARHRAWFLEFDWKYTVVVVTAILICTLACMFYVSRIAKINKMQQQIYDLKAEKMELSGKQTALKAEVDKAVNLEKIEEYARDHLKMKYPDSSSVIRYHTHTEDYFRKYK